MSWLFVLGFAALALTYLLVLPPSRDLVIKLGTLVDMAQRANPALFAAKLEPINPFEGKRFKHHRIARLLRADLSEFGALPVRLQREAKKLDARAHVGMLPMLVYVASVGLWFVMR